MKLITAIFVSLFTSSASFGFEVQSGIANGIVIQCTTVNEYLKSLAAYRAGKINLETFNMLKEVLNIKSLNLEAVRAASVVATPTTIRLRNPTTITENNESIPHGKVTVIGLNAVEDADKITISTPGSVSVSISLTLAGFCPFYSGSYAGYFRGRPDEIQKFESAVKEAVKALIVTQ